MPTTEPTAAPPASSEAEAFAAGLPEMNGLKCPMLLPSVADGLMEELYRRRWEEGRRARRRERLANHGQPTDWGTVCCLSGLPILRHARVRCFLLVREAQVFDSSSSVGYGGNYFECWRLIGLPLPGRYRYADSGVIASTSDIAWRCLRTYFRQRYNLRLKPTCWLDQIGATTVGTHHIGHPEARGNQERPWFATTLALEPAYRWLASIVGQGTKERRDRRGLRREWERWCRRQRSEIDPQLPFADERDNGGSFLIEWGMQTGPRTMNAPYTEGQARCGCLPKGPGGRGVPFGLGPALHALLRHDRAAMRALLDCKLVFDGMDELGFKLHPCGDARLFSACELGRESGDLRAQFARWASAQYRQLNLPTAD